MEGRTIRIYLPDGVPTGLLVVEIMNWTGRIVVGPRSRLDELLKRPETAGPGVYALIGDDPAQIGQEMVYLGEADDVRKRLYNHQNDETKEFWNRTVAVTSKDSNLTKAHVRYLESRLIALAQGAGRATLANATAPAPPPMPEPDVADMDFFLSQIQMVLPVVGFNFAKPKPSARPASGDRASIDAGSPELVMDAVGAEARAREVDGEFVVFEGSTARKKGIKSWDTYRELRDDLVESGKLAPSEEPEYYVFAEDVAFTSPSAAATVVYAGNQNGRVAWKLKESGKTLKEWQDQKIAASAGYLESDTESS